MPGVHLAFAAAWSYVASLTASRSWAFLLSSSIISVSLVLKPRDYNIYDTEIV